MNSLQTAFRNIYTGFHLLATQKRQCCWGWLTAEQQSSAEGSALLLTEGCAGVSVCRVGVHAGITRNRLREELFSESLPCFISVEIQ